MQESFFFCLPASYSSIRAYNSNPLTMNLNLFHYQGEFSATVLIFSITWKFPLVYAVKLEAPQPSVTTNQTSQVDLLCNMSDYIRPDNHLQWIGIDGSILSNSRRYTVTFINTTNFAAQNGGTRRSPTRLSTLTIRNVTSDDTGIYSCIVRESRQFASINLTVVGEFLEENFAVHYCF